MWEILSLILVFLLSVNYIKRQRKKKCQFPGPTGLPFVGYIPFLEKNPALTYTELAKKYGSIFTLPMGNEDWIILNSREAIHEAFVKNGKYTVNRPKITVMDEVTEGLSISFNNGPIWKCHRMFTQKTIKRFNKKMVEEKIAEEAEYLCDELRKYGGKAFDCQDLIASMSANVMMNIFMGFRLPLDDKELRRITKVVTSFSDEDGGADVGILFVAPVLRYFPVFKTAYANLVSSYSFLQGKLKTIIEKHEEEFDKNNLEDFIDYFLSEMKQGNDDSFKIQQLLVTLQDVLGAGTDTTSTSIRWCIFALVEFPKYQDILYREINGVIDPEHRITMEHESSLPYTRAFIQEIWRHRTPAPVSVNHETNNEISLQGFKIPPKTTIVSNLWAVHRNLEIFENPEEFRPERFIDEHGEFISTEHVMPFGIGSRHCIGEQMARTNVFLTFATIVQKFKILKCKDNPLPSFYEGVFAVTYSPHKFSVKFHER